MKELCVLGRQEGLQEVIRHLSKRYDHSALDIVFSDDAAVSGVDLCNEVRPVFVKALYMRQVSREYKVEGNCQDQRETNEDSKNV